MNEENTAAQLQFSWGIVIAVIRDVLRRWYLIAAVMLMAAMAAYVYTDVTYEPQYTATTTFVASMGGTGTTTYQNLAAASNVASVFTEVLNSSLLRSEVMTQTGISGFDGTITASAIAETNLLTMTVKGSDPRTVFLMAEAVIEHHDVVSKQILGNTVLEVLQWPRVPMSPSNPLNMREIVLRMAIYAAAAMALLLAGLSYMSDKIRTRDEAENKLDCRVLGELYHEKKRRSLREKLARQKKGILITNPMTSFIYTESIHKLSSRVERRLHHDQRVIMVTSLLENEGKSTVAVNLALSLAQKGKRVLLMDCDLRKPACGLILKQSQSFVGAAEVLQGKAALKDAVRQLEGSGLYLLPGRKNFRTATNLVSSTAMEDMLRQAALQFDLVIVDTPPMSLAPDAECIGAYADAAVLVVKQNEARASDINEALEVLERTEAHVLGCVLNNVLGSADFTPAFGYGTYGRYGKYGKYGYGKYGYGKYGYGHYARKSGEEDED